MKAEKKRGSWPQNRPRKVQGYMVVEFTSLGPKGALVCLGAKDVRSRTRLINNRGNESKVYWWDGHRTRELGHLEFVDVFGLIKGAS